MNVQNPRFRLFDSVRGLAALSVVLCHIALSLNGFAQPGYGRYLLQLNIGVTVFFMLSGFLLYRPFAAARFLGERRPAVGPYGIRRFFRIIPGYWVALPLIAVWLELPAVLDDPLPYFGLAQVYQPSTILKGYGVAWTLCVEAPFYVLLPLWALAMRLAPARSSRQFLLGEGLALGLIAAGGIAWIATQTPDHTGPIPIVAALATFPAFLDHFALGMGLAVLSVVLTGRDTQPLAVRIVHRAPWLPWLVAGGVWIAICNIGDPRTGSGELAKHVLRGVVAVGLLLPATFDNGRGLVRRFLADRRIQWIGLVSYSLYLWHAAIVVKGARHGWADRLGWLGFTIAALAASLAVAAVAFYLVERPGLRLGRRLAGGRPYGGRKREPAGIPAGR